MLLTPDLLPNCSEYHPNNSTNIQRQCTVTCTVENLFARQVCASMQNCHTSPSFTNKCIDCSSWIINLLLDILVCSIALRTFTLVFILTNSPTGLNQPLTAESQNKLCCAQFWLLLASSVLFQAFVRPNFGSVGPKTFTRVIKTRCNS